MMRGPVIEHLTHRLARCPAELLAEPRLRGAPGGAVDVAAVVSDLIEDLGHPGGLTDAEAKAFEAFGPAERNLARLTLIAAWLCHDDWLLADHGLGKVVLRWLKAGLAPLAKLVDAELFISDADRREELARALFVALDLVPEGETPAQAADRAKALSSPERARVLEETRAQAERARKLRAQMEEQAARDAAARYGGE